MKLFATTVALGLAAAGAAAAPNPFVGSWLYEPTAGVANFQRLTFTQGGELIANGKNVIGPYQVKGARVTARAKSGETYAYEIAADGRLCFVSGPGMTPLARPSLPSEGGPTICFRRVAGAI